MDQMDLPAALRILGVPATATRIEAARAYRALARLVHPDKQMSGGGGRTCIDSFLQIRDAYDVVLRHINRPATHYVVITPLSAPGSPEAVRVVEERRCGACADRHTQSDWNFCVSCGGSGCDTCQGDGGFFSDGRVCGVCQNQRHTLENCERILLLPAANELKQGRLLWLDGQSYVVVLADLGVPGASWAFERGMPVVRARVSLEDVLRGVTLMTPFFEWSSGGVFDPTRPVDLGRGITLVWEVAFVEDLANLRDYQDAFLMIVAD